MTVTFEINEQSVFLAAKGMDPMIARLYAAALDLNRRIPLKEIVGSARDGIAAYTLQAADGRAWKLSADSVSADPVISGFSVEKFTVGELGASLPVLLAGMDLLATAVVTSYRIAFAV